MADKIILNSTQKGFCSQYLWATIWFIALWVFARWVIKFRESLSICDLPWPQACAYLSVAVMIIIVIGSAHTMIYESREVNTLFKNEEGYWGKILCVKYGFPFSKATSQVIFDRIVSIGIEQGSLDRILNTGSLEITMITFTNANSRKKSWTMPAIKNPYDRKVELEEALMKHEGLRVKHESGK